MSTFKWASHSMNSGEFPNSQCPDQAPLARKNNNINVNNRNQIHLLQVGILLTQSGSNNTIDPNWILLDTCLMDSVFKNKSFLKGVKKCKEGDEFNIISSSGMV